MKKGASVTIYAEMIDDLGIVTATTPLAAIVKYGSGDNITVKAADGYIYQIDANIRDGDGAYKVV